MRLAQAGFDAGSFLAPTNRLCDGTCFWRLSKAGAKKAKS